ncbi:hypothetical protein V6N11_056250 [Hibiscus sabdariffa]|uniref:Uncharacterized protein n=1 Tax=Hibiscus sabdariffa TaxID=183260 RepID=A0ABR2T389_9ROSI
MLAPPTTLDDCSSFAPGCISVHDSLLDKMKDLCFTYEEGLEASMEVAVEGTCHSLLGQMTRLVRILHLDLLKLTTLVLVSKVNPVLNASVEPPGPHSDVVACDDAFPTFAPQHDEPTYEPVAAQHGAEHEDSDAVLPEHDTERVDSDPVTHADAHEDSDVVLPERDVEHDDSNPVTHTAAQDFAFFRRKRFDKENQVNIRYYGLAPPKLENSCNKLFGGNSSFQKIGS